MSRTAAVVWTVARVAVAVSLIGWAALHLRFFDRFMGVEVPQWLQPVGLAMLIVGGIFVLLCGGMLHTPAFLPTEFVVGGPFRYLRNPMSLAAVTMMLGLGLFYRSLAILLCGCFLFVLLHALVVFVEEPLLAKRFGPSYLRYKQSVNRWLPTFRR